MVCEKKSSLFFLYLPLSPPLKDCALTQRSAQTLNALKLAEQWAPFMTRDTCGSAVSVEPTKVVRLIVVYVGC